MKGHLLSPAHRLEVEILRATMSDKLGYLKLSVLISLDEGLTQEQTAVILGISSGTVFNCKKKYDSDGLEQFLDRHYVPYTGRLSETQLAELATEVDTGLYGTTRQVADWIAVHFDVQYSVSAVQAILHKLDFVYKKVLQVPGQLNAAQQEQYLEVLEPFLKEADPESEAIYFVDGVHPQHNTRADRAWIKRGTEKELKANTGRNRMNIVGGVNFCDPSDVEIVEGETVNGQTTQQLFQQLLEKHPDKKVYVFVDNARYNYNADLLEWIKGEPRLEIFYLPPYSPNLNLAERLWKFTRKKVINLKYYPTFDEFKATIRAFFRDIRQHRDELESLITPNFQRFSVLPGA
jgi:transposase